MCFREVTAGFEPAITVLQTGALPLGYRTIFNYMSLLGKNDSNGNRTRVTAVKGRCLNRLTMEPSFCCDKYCDVIDKFLQILRSNICENLVKLR